MTFSLCNTHFEHRKLHKKKSICMESKENFFFSCVESSQNKICTQRKKSIPHEFSFLREFFLCKTYVLVVLQTFKNWLKTRRMKTQWQCELLTTTNITAGWNQIGCSVVWGSVTWTSLLHGLWKKHFVTISSQRRAGLLDWLQLCVIQRVCFVLLY